jgi:hypothetical protein
MEVCTLIGCNLIFIGKFIVMGKIFLIDECELRGLISEAMENAVDNITKKITARSARLNYRNRLFQDSEDDDEDYSGFCGSSSVGGCGSSSYGGGCGSGGGGCGSSSYGGGCGSTGGC